jgi:hypothetical protein
MAKDTLFPQIPRDPHTLVLLDSIDSISMRILKDQPQENHLFQCASFLHFIATAPVSYDWAYFKVHEGTRDMCRSLSDYYNHYIHSQGDAYKLEVLNREIGSFSEYFNDFQLALYYVDLRAKENPSLLPLNDLIWGFYCSLYSRKRCEAFLESYFNIIQSLTASA